MYAAQIRRLFQHFPRNQILFVTVDQLIADTNGLLDEVCGFLGITADTAYPRARVVHQIEPRDDLGAMSQDDRSYLQTLFLRDIRETAELTGLDLATWL